MTLFQSGKDEHIATLERELQKERDRFDALLERYHELRFQGAIVPRTPPTNGAVHAPARDMDQIGRDGARREAIARMQADFIRKGASPAEAYAEAERVIATLGPYEEE